MKVKEFFADYIPRLQKISSTPHLDLEVILGFVLNRSKSFLYTHPNFFLSPTKDIFARRLLIRRLSGEPIAYVVRQKEFYGHTFFVNQATLIPRPETEFLVEQALLYSRSCNHPLIIDIGTGSGNIIISLAKEKDLTHARFIASDLSQPALQVARENARRLGVDMRIQFFLGDLIQPIHHLFLTTDNLILAANLPYLPEHFRQTVSRDIFFEPQDALWSGTDGLEHYRRLLKQLSLFQLSSFFVCIFEIFQKQKTAFRRQCARILPSYHVNFVDVSTTKVTLAVIKSIKSAT